MSLTLYTGCWWECSGAALVQTITVSVSLKLQWSCYVQKAFYNILPLLMVFTFFKKVLLCFLGLRRGDGEVIFLTEYQHSLMSMPWLLMGLCNFHPPSPPPLQQAVPRADRSTNLETKIELFRRESDGDNRPINKTAAVISPLRPLPWALDQLNRTRCKVN